MEDGQYTIKLSQATFLESIGKRLGRMTPAERSALIGAGVGGTTLALRRLLSRRDKDHKKRGVISQVLLGALLGGTAGYGLSAAFGGQKPTPNPESETSTPETKSVGDRAADAVNPAVEAVGEFVSPVAKGTINVGKDVAVNVGDFAAGVHGSGALAGGAAGLGWAAKSRHNASKLPTELQTWINSLPADSKARRAAVSILTNEARYLRDTKMTPAQRFIHQNPRYAAWANAPVGSIRRGVVDWDVNRILPPAVPRKARLAQEQAYKNAPRWKKRLGLVKKPKTAPPPPALVTKGRHAVKGPARGAAQTVESVKQRGMKNLGYGGGFGKPGPSKWVYTRRGVGGTVSGLLAELAARKGYNWYYGDKNDDADLFKPLYTRDK